MIATIIDSLIVVLLIGSIGVKALKPRSVCLTPSTNHAP